MALKLHVLMKPACKGLHGIADCWPWPICQGHRNEFLFCTLILHSLLISCADAMSYIMNCNKRNVGLVVAPLAYHCGYVCRYSYSLGLLQWVDVYFRNNWTFCPKILSSIFWTRQKWENRNVLFVYILLAKNHHVLGRSAIQKRRCQVPMSGLVLFWSQ